MNLKNIEEIIINVIEIETDRTRVWVMPSTTTNIDEPRYKL